MTGKRVLVYQLACTARRLPHAAFGQARDTASLFGTITDTQGATVYPAPR